MQRPHWVYVQSKWKFCLRVVSYVKRRRQCPPIKRRINSTCWCAQRAVRAKHMHGRFSSADFLSHSGKTRQRTKRHTRERELLWIIYHIHMCVTAIFHRWICIGAELCAERLIFSVCYSENPVWNVFWSRFLRGFYHVICLYERNPGVAIETPIMTPEGHLKITKVVIKKQLKALFRSTHRPPYWLKQNVISGIHWEQANQYATSDLFVCGAFDVWQRPTWCQTTKNSTKLYALQNLRSTHKQLKANTLFLINLKLLVPKEMIIIEKIVSSL
jgi:hypothetical protein